MNFDSREFRNAMGRFATGVCVITAHPEGAEPFGMTVNSFASVSLEPPLLLWSLQNNSECFDQFAKTKRWTVNVLANDQLALSNQYAKKGQHTLDKNHYRIGVSGAPVLRGSLTSFECEDWQRYDGGDHLILVGHVLAMEARPTGRPLLFYGGRYGELR